MFGYCEIDKFHATNRSVTVKTCKSREIQYFVRSYKTNRQEMLISRILAINHEFLMPIRKVQGWIYNKTLLHLFIFQPVRFLTYPRRIS